MFFRSARQAQSRSWKKYQRKGKEYFKGDNYELHSRKCNPAKRSRTILLWRMYAKNEGFRFLQIYRKEKRAESLKLTEENSLWERLNPVGETRARRQILYSTLSKNFNLPKIVRGKDARIRNFWLNRERELGKHRAFGEYWSKR